MSNRKYIQGIEEERVFDINRHLRLLLETASYTNFASYDLENLGALLREIRHERNLSLQKVAVMCRISYQHLCMIERGRRPSIKLLHRLLKVYRAKMYVRAVLEPEMDDDTEGWI